LGAGLEFEKPINELKSKIKELESFMEEKDIDLTDELESLQKRLKELKEKTYGNLSAWDRVQLARHMERPTTLDYIPHLFADFIECHGDRLFGDDQAIVGGIARYKGRPVTIIGEQRGRDTKENLRRNFGMPHPEGYRKALRLMKQAEKFGRPVISFIDTKGAFPGKTAEERGQGEAIARNLFEMAGLKVPIICIVIGEGASGGALAIGVGDRLLMLENSWYSVIAPESAAALLWRDSTKAERAAKTMKITAPDLKELGIVDEVIPEVPGGAHHDQAEQAAIIDGFLTRHLNELLPLSENELTENRLNKYRKLGEYSVVTDYTV
jgi:acetyl-CoA carboxylase carboxyl transferase subunit alpha